MKFSRMKFETFLIFLYLAQINCCFLENIERKINYNIEEKNIFIIENSNL